MIPAISLEAVSKRFRVPLDRSATLKYRVTHPRRTSRYRDFYALRDVSFAIAPGEFVGIIGPNGCGKSTLLKILSRIYQPTTGRVIVNGRVSPFLELGVGFNPELTGRENVFLNGAILGLSRGELQRRVPEIIAFAELEDFAQQKIKNYSSGMQVRLAFSVAIQADAGILLMDEVLAVGDQRFQDKCFEVFARYKRHGRTVVLVTHDLSAIDLYCDRAILLDHGALVADGTAADTTATYRRRVGVQADGDEAMSDQNDVNRWGSREVELTDVKICDAAGRPHHDFLTGQPFEVEIGWVVNEDVEEFVCGIGIERADGLAVAGTNTAIDRFSIHCPAAGTEGVTRYRVEALHLLGSTYFLTVAIADRHFSKNFDRIERALTFHVTEPAGHVGVVVLDGRWTTTIATERAAQAG